MDHPDDEFLAGTAFAVDEHRGIDRCHAGREFENLLHGFAACDEVLRGRMSGDSLAKKIEFAFTLFECPLPTRQLLQPALNHGSQPLDFLAEILALKVLTQPADVAAPSSTLRPTIVQKGFPCPRHDDSRK